LEIKVTRSPRRKSTVSARLVGDVLEVLAPAGIPEDQLREVAAKLQARLEKRQAKRRLDGDDALRQRAEELNKQYFKGRLKVESIEYVTNQNHRFGSCAVQTRRIRLSLRLSKVPAWVRDYVILHELAHLVHADHSPAFWRLVQAYPLAERARGYLMAVNMEEDGLEMG
jgi:predicted metal-dependent hydrolase